MLKDLTVTDVWKDERKNGATLIIEKLRFKQCTNVIFEASPL